MKPHPFATPVKLPTVCNENLDFEKIIAAGTGRKSFEDDSYLEDDHRIRYIQLDVLPTNHSLCQNRTSDYPVGSLICALPEGGQTPCRRDSGIYRTRETKHVQTCLYVSLNLSFFVLMIKVDR